MFLHHMTATLQLQIHLIREIKIYGNYKQHAQNAKNDSFKVDKTIYHCQVLHTATSPSGM